METKKYLALQIAGFDLKLDARDSSLDLAVPFIYEKFLSENLNFMSAPETDQQTLLLTIHNDQQFTMENRGVPVCRTEIWELWIDENGDHVFTSPRQFPPKRVIIDPNFRTGEIVGDFSLVKDLAIYPLSSIDIRIMVNWLAAFGDLILHAAGVSLDGQGYCFIGEAGKGKSTLASALAKDESVTVLGEDQVILRYLDGQFWIFGTPWHEHVEMCSPIGVPLRKIFFLDREMDEEIKQVSPSEGLTRILQTAFVPYYLPEKVHLIMGRLSVLTGVISFFGLNYKLGSDILSLILD